MYDYLIVVARDRPEVFQELKHRLGHEMQILVDRRQEPRLVLDREVAQVRQMQAVGFTMMPTKYGVQR